MSNKKLLSIVTPCYNEQDNVAEVYSQVKAVMDTFPDYNYEHIFIDIDVFTTNFPEDRYGIVA